MALKLMYITNNTKVMILAEKYGVDRIFIDMETIGKEERQPKMDTVKSFHTVEDVAKARNVLNKSEILVRINSLYEGTKKEVNAVIDAGADIIMLPYFKNAAQAREFIECVNGRAKTCLLFETDDSVKNVDEILSIPGIDEIHIGINDMSLCYKKKFMFELLTDGTVEYLCKKFKEKNIPYGFGGIARLHHGEVPAEMIIAEHYRLGSSMSILSRSFCNISSDLSMDEIEQRFNDGISEIKNYENSLLKQSEDFFEKNKLDVAQAVERVVNRINRVN